jgi:hypothetical protein
MPTMGQGSYKPQNGYRKIAFLKELLGITLHNVGCDERTDFYYRSGDVLKAINHNSSIGSTNLKGRKDYGAFEGRLPKSPSYRNPTTKYTTPLNSMFRDKITLPSILLHYTTE